jgi:glucoamylase
MEQEKVPMAEKIVINGNGGGGSGNGGADSGTVDTSSGHNVLIASDPVTATNAANRTYAVPVYSALDATPFFLQETNGFVGVGSDPLGQLQASHAFTTVYSDAINGNLVQGAQVDISRGGNFTLALGFGTGLGGALSAAESTLATSFNSLRKDYEREWEAYDAGLKAPPAHLNGVGTPQWRALVNEYYLSANILKAAEDKTYPGALQAGPTSPWGRRFRRAIPTILISALIGKCLRATSMKSGPVYLSTGIRRPQAMPCTSCFTVSNSPTVRCLATV